MLNVYCNTVPRGWGGRNEKGVIHWHVNIQAGGLCSRGAVPLTDRLEQVSDTKPIFPFWAQSSSWICKVSMRAWLARKGVPLTGGACGCKEQAIQKSLWWLPLGLGCIVATVLLAQSSSGWRQFTWRDAGTPRLEGEGHCNPHGCCFPQPTPPISLKPLSQFAHWNSVNHHLKEMRATGAV